MTDETPEQFPSYQGAGPQFASHAHAKPLLKLMIRALQGKRGKSIWAKPAKRKKARIV